MSSRSQAVITALFVVFLWATSWVLIKIGLQNLPPITFAGLRYTLASLCLVPVVVMNRRIGGLKSLSAAVWWRLILLGILFYALTQGASFVALSRLPAVTVNLLWSFSSVTVAVMGIVWLAELPTGQQWFGVLIALVGAVVYFTPVRITAGQGLGLTASLIGVLANSSSSILGREINRPGDLSPLLVTVISMGIGSVLLLIAGIAIESFPRISLQEWAIIGWLAVVNTAFAFTLWNRTLQTLSSLESSMINGTMMLWIPILAVLFLGERLNAKEILGLVAAGVGTTLVQLRKPQSLTRLFKGIINR